MPKPYQNIIIDRQTTTGILYKFTAVFDSDLGTVDRANSSYDSGTSFPYIPTTTNYKLRQTYGGWVDDMDLIIWVNTTLNISTNNKYDPDVVLIDGKYYRVEHVTGDTFFKHTYRLVGLKVSSDGVIATS